MSKYRYQVINKENKQLTGTIGAPDEQSARNELKELGFAVLSIQEIKEEELQNTADKKLPIFEFSAIDKNKKRVGGSIQAADKLSAYKRLISEYNLEVEYLIENTLSSEQKESEKKKGIYELQVQLEEEVGKQKPTFDEKELQEFTQKQEVLKSQIEFVLHKVKEILDQYERQLKPETKENLRRQVEKILRIKNSTNLDYIRQTAEDLLSFLQKEELFLNEELLSRERTKMLVEAKGMMIQLKKGGNGNKKTISDNLRTWRENHIIGKQASLAEQLINTLISPIIGAAPETPEIIKCRLEIKNTQDQFRQYLQLYFQSSTPEMKLETKESLKRIWQQKKKLKKDLKTLRKAAYQNYEKTGQPSAMITIRKELLTFSGYLLTLYLLYYFSSLYLTTKEFGLGEIPLILYVFRSNFIKYLIPTIFIIHGGLAIKNNFFEKNRWATTIIAPFSIIGLTIIYLNF